MSNVQYRGSAGVTRDFVELPSQIMENWLLEPEVLAVYAKHYETGEVIPAELVAKIQAAEQFNQGFTSVEYLAACYLDMDWHTLEDPAGVDVTEFEKASMDKIGLIPEIVVRYRSPYFSHITGGYSAGYYSYIWSEVLDADAFEAFKETSLFDQETAAGLPHQHPGKGRLRRSRGALPALPRPAAERRTAACRGRASNSHEIAGRKCGRPIFLPIKTEAGLPASSYSVGRKD